MTESKTIEGITEGVLDRFKKLLIGEIIPPRDKTIDHYDSDWERNFKWVLLKHLPDCMTLSNQEPFGAYRADYTIKCEKTGRKWIFEFDGKAFHDPFNDSLRDSHIFSIDKNVQRIFRIDAKTGEYYPEETREKLCEICPECFDMSLEGRTIVDWQYLNGDHMAEIINETLDDDRMILKISESQKLSDKDLRTHCAVMNAVKGTRRVRTF